MDGSGLAKKPGSETLLHTVQCTAVFRIRISFHADLDP